MGLTQFCLQVERDTLECYDEVILLHIFIKTTKIDTNVFSLYNGTLQQPRNILHTDFCFTI